MGLTGGEHWDASQLELSDGELVTTLTRAEVSHFRHCFKRIGTVVL